MSRMNELHPSMMTDDDGDIRVFATVADTCLFMEGTGVEDGIYQVYDSVGNRASPVVLEHPVVLERLAGREPRP